ncbi:MAG: thiamine phosphate synthase [Pseudomonadota bacterium]|nr:thiamine phosphate synthase [Pseudomonadota bacterium]
MAANQPQWPREWLMTDERLGERLREAIEALPSGAGVVFRHYGLTNEARLELGLRLAEIARERDLMLAVAGSQILAERLGAALVHNPDEPGAKPCSMAVHDEQQALAARSAGAVLAFVGPVFPTRSHPGAPALGVGRATALAGQAGCPAIALGGMNRARFEELKFSGFYGWAGIDAWLGEIRT